MSILNRHPFPVKAFFEKSLVLGYAAPKESVAELIPECLEPDLLEERFAFLAVAMVQAKGLRPEGFPRIFGRDFVLVGYRIFVRYRGLDGRRLRGLYILGSQTDKPSMRWLGSLFTQYRYQLVPIAWSSANGREVVTAPDGFHVEAEPAGEEERLPKGSPFSTWREARRFAGPMPFTFSYDAAAREVIIVEGVRPSWTPRPMSVLRADVPSWSAKGCNDLTLANAFFVEQVPYRWKRGRVERWTS